MYKFILLLIIYLSRSLNAAWIPPPTKLAEYDGYGSMLTMNENVIILAQNDIKHFQIVTDPFTNRSRLCSARYISIKHDTDSFTDFIYSVSIGSNQQRVEDEVYFAYIDEDISRNLFLTIVFYSVPYSLSSCNNYRRHLDLNITDLSFTERAIIGMDPRGSRVYVVGLHHIVVVDIRTQNALIYTKDDVFGLSSFGPSPLLLIINIFPKAISVSEDQQVYVIGQRHYNFQFLAYLHVLDFSDLNHNQVRLRATLPLSAFNYGIAAVDISRYSMMSIFIDEEQQLMIIGIPYVDTVLLLTLNTTEQPVIIKTHESREKRVSFGKSVVLLPDNSYAVLAYTQSTLPWSTSQVHVYSLNDDSDQPLFVYPNNQQVMPTMNLIQPPYGILTMVGHKSHVAFVVEAGGFLLLPSSPAGYCSSKLDKNIFYAGNYTSLPCPSGTARNTHSFGPCFICPANTKNNGSFGSDCESCSDNSSLLCLRGTKHELDISRVSSFDQADPYPVSPDSTEFDDVLLENIFMFNVSSGYCLTVSPLFWITLMLGLSCIIIISISRCDPNKRSRCVIIKTTFRHFDLIGDGKLWVGGIISLAIIVLIGFTWRFSMSFSQLYPIETTSEIDRISISCNLDLLNSKFSTALQLLSTHKHEEEKPIFEMLNEQDIILTAEFISTQFSCDDVMMQRNMDKGQQITTSDFNCTYDNETNILSLSTLLPQHLITVQFSLTGSSFIGGLRICLNGPSMIQNEGQYTVHELDICQFFFTPNETFTANSIINIKTTKSINRTAPLRSSDDTIFTGLWLSSFTVNTLADTLLFDQSGEHRRYLSDRVLLVVDFTESEYYRENSQEPIARQNEIIFHTVLFSMVCLDFFGLLFLLFKLVIIPSICIIRNRYLRRYQTVDLNEIELRDFVQQQIDEAIKEWELKKTTIRYFKDVNTSSVDMRKRHGDNLADRF